jgi:hypothetical protein
MITEENINLINQITALLKEKVPYDFIHEAVEIGDTGIFIYLPGNDEGFSLTIPEFLDFGNKLKGFEVIDNGRIHIAGFAYQIVQTGDTNLDYYLRRTEEFYSVEDVAEIRIIEAPYWIALACIKLDSYHEYGTNYSDYSVIEIEYQEPEKRISLEDETNLIYSYLFEIADTSGFVFHLSKIKEYDNELIEKIEALFNNDNSDDDEAEELPSEEVELKPLLIFTEAMRLYVSALQTTDSELKLLNFYKIFEYYAPIVISIESYEQLSKKLDSPKVLKPDRAFLKSIFDLVDSNRQRLRDGELVKAVINKCFDLIDIFQDLPQSIQKRILGNIKEKELSYETAKEKLLQASNYLATIVYSTRNQVVHAKSNFTPSGDECRSEDLSQLNNFLKKATALTIRWHSKLPDYQKNNI